MVRKTCVITGGCGFIGSSLAAKLLEKYRVIVLDNFATGNKENVKVLLKDKHFELQEYNVQDPIRVSESVDYVFHLASRASPRDYQKFPVDTMMTNAKGTYNALVFAQNTGARFLLSSTSEVYGDPLEHPQKETYWGNVNPIGPRSCYDEGKRFAEALVTSFRQEKNIDTRISRIFNTYGPNMNIHDGRVIPTFIAQALRGENITVFGDGSHTRSFCYVSDTVEALISLMTKDGLSGEVVNIGNPQELSITDIAQKIITLTGSSSTISNKPLPTDDPLRRQPNIEKARKLLDWEPVVSLDEGLKKTIAYFKDKL